MGLNLVIITSIWTAFFTIFFSLLGQILMEEIKKNVKNKYFLHERLYIPYVKIYNKLHRGSSLDFNDLEGDKREEVINLLVENIIYVNDKNLSDKMYELYSSYNRLFYEFEDSTLTQLIDNVNKNYRYITDYIFEKVDILRVKDSSRINYL